jgi:hypothetical protein
MHRLAEIRRRTGTEHIHPDLLIAERRHDDYGTIRSDRSESMDIINTARTQTNLGQNQIRHGSEDQVKSLLPVSRFAKDIPFAPQAVTKETAHLSVIVHHKYGRLTLYHDDTFLSISPSLLVHVCKSVAKTVPFSQLTATHKTGYFTGDSKRTTGLETGD